MIETMKYVRVPFHVDAVQVTAENMAEVAKWCGGQIATVTDDGVVSVSGSKFINVRHVKRPLTPRQKRAFVGDWVLYAGSGFKVYTDTAFQKCFEPKPRKVWDLAADSTELDNVVDESGDTSENNLSTEELLTAIFSNEKTLAEEL